jgi:hypothetical protein
MNRMAVPVVISFLGLSCSPAHPPVKEQLAADHPGCQLQKATDWQSDPSTLYVSVTFQCPQQELAVETWMYQEHNGQWRRLRTDVDPRRAGAPLEQRP